jgi:hypothetical protein
LIYSNSLHYVTSIYTCNKSLKIHHIVNLFIVIQIICLRLRVCCRITCEVEKCFMKYKSRGVSRGFSISNNISTSKLHVLYNKYANKNIILILQSVKYKVDFHPQRESKMCQYTVGSASTPRFLTICLFPAYVHCISEVQYIHVYIQFWRLFSMIKFKLLVFYSLKYD